MRIPASAPTCMPRFAGSTEKPTKIAAPPSDMCQPRCAISCLMPDPVCGEYGNTHVCDEMDAHCNGVEIVHPGECDNCVCQDVWDPVCGVDGTTYGNTCEARCAGAEVAGPELVRLQAPALRLPQDLRSGLRCERHDLRQQV